MVVGVFFGGITSAVIAAVIVTCIICKVQNIDAGIILLIFVLYLKNTIDNR